MIPSSPDISYMAICGFVGKPKLPKHRAVDIDFIIKTVYNEFDVDVSLMKVSNNKREVVNSKFSAMFMLRRHTNLTLGEIGYLFGRRHSDVIRAIRNVQDWIDVKDYAVDILDEIERKINEAYS